MWFVGSDPHNSKTREALRVAGPDNIAEGAEGDWEIVTLVVDLPASFLIRGTASND
jgi:hypothetical protein